MRRKLLEVRKEFEDVLNDLEKNSNFVCWKTTTLGLPLISSDRKVLHSVDKEKISRTKENDDEVKQRDSLEDEFAVKLSVKEFETMLNAEHSEQSNGEGVRLTKNLCKNAQVLERQILIVLIATVTCCKLTKSLVKKIAVR